MSDFGRTANNFACHFSHPGLFVAFKHNVNHMSGVAEIFVGESELVVNEIFALRTNNLQQS
jgi:hypothetical protein